LKANSKALQEETDPECFRTIKARQTRHPIPALQKIDGGIAAEHPHITQELLDALYGGEHRRANTGMRAKAERLNTGILKAAIRQSPNGAAPGPDHITTRLVKELCRLREDLFLRTMNRAWTQGIPDSWKSSNTILIPKAKKATYTIAKSWRPIQLQSILAKVLERAAVQRIADLGLLESNMYGGRKPNGTTDAIQALNDAITNNPGSYTCLTALDIEGGFDHLQLDKVCQTIARKSQNLAQWIEHWGTNRATSDRFNGKNSKAFATDNGTPQGSPLCPILFLVSIRDIAAMATTNFPAATNRILTYVDDILLVSSYKNATTGQEATQKTLENLETTAHCLGYTFAPTKAECLHIKTPDQHKLYPHIGRGPIEEQKENMRWLGYCISNNLKWDYHIAQWTKKAMRTGYNLKALTSRYQTGGLNTWTTLRLIKGLIIPQPTYGIEVWKTKTPIGEAQTVLNNIVRKAYGLETKRPLAAIYCELGIPPLTLYTKHRQRMLAMRAHTLSRQTNCSKEWLQSSEMEHIITQALGDKEGKRDIRGRLLLDWTGAIQNEKIRYNSKPRASHRHLRGTTRAEFRDLLYLRSRAAWPYQDTDGTRRKCPSDRDIITPDHLMNYCGLIKPTQIPLHSNKKLRELLDWMKTWPDALKDRPTRRWKTSSNTAQVQGTTINLPTSQATGAPRGGKPKSRKKCGVCGFHMQRDKVAQEKHARTHDPTQKRRRKGAGGTAAT